MVDDSKHARGRRRGRRRPDSEERDILDMLSPVEAASVLRALLERRPKLREQAREAAKELVDDVSPEGVAEDVKWSMLQLGYEELNARAGRHEWGYVEPTDAAWELLEEAIEDFVMDARRRRELGLVAAAESMFQGIVLGLYEIRDAPSGDVLGWAPDFPAEAAGQAIETLLKATPPEDRSHTRDRIKAFLEEWAPEWTGMRIDGC